MNGACSSVGNLPAPAPAARRFAIPGAHPPQAALLAARLRPADAPAVGDQVDVQLVGVLGVGDREHLVVGALERGRWPGTARAARRPGRRGCRPGSRAARGRRSSRRPPSCARPRAARPGTRSPRRGRRRRASRGSARRRLERSAARAAPAGSAAPSIGARPPGRIASSTTSTGGVADLDPGRQRLAQALVGDVAIAVVGVLGEDRPHQLGDRVAVRVVDRAPVELAQPVADRAHPLRAAGAASRRLRLARPACAPSGARIFSAAMAAVEQAVDPRRRGADLLPPGRRRRARRPSSCTATRPHSEDWLPFLRAARRPGARPRPARLGRRPSARPRRFDYSMHGPRAVLRALPATARGRRATRSSSTTGASSALIAAQRRPSARAPAGDHQRRAAAARLPLALGRAVPVAASRWSASSPT